jgi:hypothetical protein
MFPSQQRALRRAFKKADKFDHFRKRTRRSFVLGGIGAVVAAAGAFWAGLAVGSDVQQAEVVADRWRKKLPWAEEFAYAPIETLETARASFLTVIEQTGGTETTWHGFARLANRAIEKANRDLALRLLEVVRLAPPPDSLRPLVDSLHEVR